MKIVMLYGKYLVRHANDCRVTQNFKLHHRRSLRTPKHENTQAIARTYPGRERPVADLLVPHVLLGQKVSDHSPLVAKFAEWKCIYVFSKKNTIKEDSLLKFNYKIYKPYYYNFAMKRSKGADARYEHGITHIANLHPPIWCPKGCSFIARSRVRRWWSTDTWRYWNWSFQ